MRPPPHSGDPGSKRPTIAVLVGWLLGLVLPAGTVGNSIRGDLEEELIRDLDQGSPKTAILRYLHRAISVGFRFALSPTLRSRHTPSRHPREAGVLMNSLVDDLKHAFRILVRRPALTLGAIVSLGLGIGANTAIFSLVHTILIKPLPYPDAEELVELFRIDETVTGLNPPLDRVSGLWAVPYEVHLDWLDGAPVFEAGGGYAGTRLSLQRGERSTGLVGARMTSGAFEALDIRPLLGRLPLPDDDAVGAPPVAVLGYGFWQTHLGGDPTVVGTQLVFSEVSHTIIGVMPKGFAFPSDTYGVWVSFTDQQKTSPVRNGGYMKVVARLAEGVSVDQARRDMEQVAFRIGERHPDEAEHRIGIFPQKEMIVGNTGSGLLVLLGAVVLVLLIACTNIAGLFLIRASERKREIGIRRALGAGQNRLVAQQMFEALILSLLGGILGWTLAVVGMDPILSLMPSELPRIEEMAVDTRFLATAMAFALAAGMLIGFLPAFRAARTPITTVLREGGRSLAGGRRGNRTQTGLVTAQVALAFVLLAGAGLVLRSLTGLVAVDIGFRTDNLALATVSYPTGTETPEDAALFFQSLEDRVRDLPGVIEVGSADQIPFSGGWSSPPATMETANGERDAALHMPAVTAEYFDVMGIPLLEGRGLTDEDTMDSDLVVVVSQALAKVLTPDGSALGLRIRLNVGDEQGWRTIVGVVGDVRYRLDFGAMRMAYVPAAQYPTYMDNWVVRTAGDPGAVASAFRDVWEEIDPEGTTSFQLMDDVVHGSRAAVSARFSVYLLGSLALLAGVLAVIGVYGVLAYLVQLRSREIGIQLALGAERGTVVGMILRRGLIMGGMGLGGGLLLALGMGRVMESQLFGVEPWDPVTLAAAGGLMLVSTVVASYLPAYRASRLDPVKVLHGK